MVVGDFVDNKFSTFVKPVTVVVGFEGSIIDVVTMRLFVGTTLHESESKTFKCITLERWPPCGIYSLTSSEAKRGRCCLRNIIFLHVEMSFGKINKKN